MSEQPLTLEEFEQIAAGERLYSSGQTERKLEATVRAAWAERDDAYKALTYQGDKAVSARRWVRAWKRAAKEERRHWHWAIRKLCLYDARRHVAVLERQEACEQRDEAEALVARVTALVEQYRADCKP